VRVTADGLLVRTDADERHVPADGVVIAEPVHPVALAGLDRLTARVAHVGDARAARDIASAIAEAREIVEAKTITS
jgi:hypothetical protein